MADRYVTTGTFRWIIGIVATGIGALVLAVLAGAQDHITTEAEVAALRAADSVRSEDHDKINRIEVQVGHNAQQIEKLAEALQSDTERILAAIAAAQR